MRIDTHPMPIDSSPDHVEEVYRCPSLTVRAMALRADPWSSIVRPSVPNDSTEANGFLLPGPADLSRDHLRSWHDNILSAMFQHPETHPEPGGHAPGFIRLTRPDHRYQLPLPDPDETETDMVYICQAPPVPGKFDNAKASALKVPNGPIRRQLVQGETIEFEDEDAEGGRRIIRPEDVIGSSALGGVSVNCFMCTENSDLHAQVLIVVTCSIANLPVLLASKAFHPYQQLPHRAEFTQTVRVHLVVHRVPTKVWIDKGYQEWMKAFGSDTQVGQRIVSRVQLMIQ